MIKRGYVLGKCVRLIGFPGVPRISMGVHRTREVRKRNKEAARHLSTNNNA